ncbi:MAG: rhomboid family intramembrane serine protease [Acaryochloridaceae cyanobacterium SU_2_1]|nr:rhomboid family intramembrane serine protease [Acaryochloridaceae cyanobacterium SU_2_1]
MDMTVASALYLQVKILGGFVAVLWGLELVDTLLLRGWLNQFGILPRRWRGLRGVLLAPLLHRDLRHLTTNTVPLVVLGGLILWQSTSLFLLVTAGVWLLGGLGVWFLGGRNSNHIGASGLVFGYLGFLLAQGFFEQSGAAIALSLIAGLLYGSTLWGILPFQRGVSWQGHLFGCLVGGAISRYQAPLQQWFLSLTHWVNLWI